MNYSRWTNKQLILKSKLEEEIWLKLTIKHAKGEIVLYKEDFRLINESRERWHQIDIELSKRGVQV